MRAKKIVISLFCMFTIILLCSTSYAASNDSNIRKDLEKDLAQFEQVFTFEKSHYNLEDSDIVENNLELGEIYENNTIDISESNSTKELSQKLKHNNKYVSTIKLKDSGKPIALAFIEKKDSKWIISRINSYNLLEEEIDSYKESVDGDPVVIIDEANKIYALGSEKKEKNLKKLEANDSLNLKIIETNKLLNLQNGQVEDINEIQSKLKKERKDRKSVV